MGGWRVELSDEIAAWYATLDVRGLAQADRALDRLRDQGPALRMPHSKPLDDGLLELRFTCRDHVRRITYYFGSERAAITLTTFAKQKQNERQEVRRARNLMWKLRGRSK